MTVPQHRLFSRRSILPTGNLATLCRPPPNDVATRHTQCPKGTENS